MKIKSLIMILCLFLGAASIQLSAQSENRTYQGWIEFSLTTPVYCEDELVDVLSCDIKAHLVYHIKDGEGVWRTDQLKGTGTSSNPGGEKFKYREIDTYISDETATFHYNAKGDMGNHYIGSMHVDFSGGWGNEIFTPLRTVCN